MSSIQAQLYSAVTRQVFEWGDFDAFRSDPLAIWVELNLGIELPDDEPPRRAKPMTLQAASQKLAQDCGSTVEEARNGLQRFLIAAHEVQTPQGRPPFAFKLHQFISGPGKVLATLEAQGKRHITLDAQRFAPGRQDEGVQLYPVHFCRDCGQEYHPVWRSRQDPARYRPREIDDIASEDRDDMAYGFLCPVRASQQYRGQLEDLPETWLDLSRAEPKVKQNYKKAVPYRVTVDTQGSEGGGEQYWYIPGKFRFCLSCGQVHEAHGKDINRLSSLSGEGRSSATTILTLSALRQLFTETESALPGQPDPRKLLGFTDNRQDAALQAGHFNDFVFLLTLRSGLIGALQVSNGELNEEQLADAVFKAL
ncbi:MAG: DEAD/DEAH box helicase, partial [Methylocaldum sp.]|nr:DEAD/DEAH box helicase [Methylocaldum sp.]